MMIIYKYKMLKSQWIIIISEWKDLPTTDKGLIVSLLITSWDCKSILNLQIIQHSFQNE